uniref:Uncharacterized protein n=1 Tax=Aegilops tauschii subsp. strangulata TaxID=200361 RepID=A0A453INE5_AEGTS
MSRTRKRDAQPYRYKVYVSGNSRLSPLAPPLAQSLASSIVRTRCAMEGIKASKTHPFQCF